MNIEDSELKEYLNKMSCRGCYNQCSLGSPTCGISKVFIEEAIEKFNKSRSENR